MDCVTPCIGPMCTVLLGWASPNLRNMWDLKMNMEEFSERKRALKAKGKAVEKCIELEKRNRMEVRDDVEYWLNKYKQMDIKCTGLQEKFSVYETRRNCFSCIEYYKFCQEVAKMINEMETHISQTPNNMLRPTEQPPPNVEIENTEYIAGLRSIEKSRKAVYEALNDENVTVIGLWGMGGIGKTTLMQNINNEMGKGSNFKYVIMVNVSSNPDVRKIQDQIKRRLPNMNFGDFKDIPRSAARAKILSERLKEVDRLGSVLIIFDDVWGSLNFPKIGIPKSKLCKIVLTTRKQNVCKRLGAKEIKMGVLDHEDSWKLFKEINVGMNIVVDPKIKKTAHDVCKECAGLPLAISVVANSLKNETDEQAWCEALQFLMNSNPQGVDNLEKEVYNPLRLSYDRLERNDLKDFFLLCSLFPKGQEIQLYELIFYGIGEGTLLAMRKIGIESLNAFLHLSKQLKSNGLLQDSDDGVRMHDIVRAVAINIAKEKGFLIKTGRGCKNWAQLEEQENLKGMKWISLMENSLKDLTDKPQNVQGLEFLSLNGNKELKNIHSDFFEEMQNLLLLDLRETSISELTQGIQKLKKLRVLMYGQGPYYSGVKISIPIKELVTLKNLSVLCLKNSYIQELGEEFGTLVHLRVIDFSHTSIDIIRPNVFSRLQKLEVLFMKDSYRHWKASDEEEGDRVSFVELATLVHLYALEVDIEDEHIFSNQYRSVDCFPSVKHFSFRSNFDSPYYYSISEFNSLVLRQNTQNIAEWLKILLEKTSSLEMCVDCRCSVDALIEPDTFKDIHNLEVLFINGGFNYKNVIKYSSNTESDERPILPNLKEITIYLNDSSDTIIATPSLLPHGSFNGLVEINIWNCNGMRFAFTWSMVQCLVQLRRIHIQECDELKHIIGNDGYNNFDCLTIGGKLFSKLEDMILNDLPKLKSVWQQEESQENMKVQWPSMKDFRVVKCKNLKPFVFGKQSAPALERIVSENEWFNDLIWEDEETKNNFKSLFVEYDFDDDDDDDDEDDNEEDNDDDDDEDDDEEDNDDDDNDDDNQVIEDNERENVYED